MRAPRRPEVVLPPLRPFGDGRLAAEGDYDGVEFGDRDFTAERAPGARFLDCAVRRCAFDEAVLTGARFIDTVLSEVRGVGTDLSSATLRDVEVRDARLGGAQLHGAVLERVLVRGGKIDYLNLRGARLRDVVFEDCVLAEPDFGGARLERVAFLGGALRGADFGGARLTEVDLRAAGGLEITRGLEDLAGAVISPEQLFDLAPALAARIGLRVAPA
ncbi:pentapeptide repeat-containing protein [Streptomyces pactum]|uniref:pentapeptide repeat-containing protein n=1 Tax=Streptomyces pactum TaxID=68249 RepID=UPI003701635C